MQGITTVTDLKNAIEQMESVQREQGTYLNEQFKRARVSFEPFRMFEATLSDTVEQADLIHNLITVVMGIGATYVSRKLFAGAAAKGMTRLLGNLAQIGIAALITRNPGLLKYIAQRIFKGFFRNSGATG